MTDEEIGDLISTSTAALLVQQEHLASLQALVVSVFQKGGLTEYEGLPPLDWVRRDHLKRILRVVEHAKQSQPVLASHLQKIYDDLK